MYQWRPVTDWTMCHKIFSFKSVVLHENLAGPRSILEHTVSANDAYASVIQVIVV